MQTEQLKPWYMSDLSEAVRCPQCLWNGERKSCDGLDSDLCPECYRNGPKGERRIKVELDESAERCEFCNAILGTQSHPFVCGGKVEIDEEDEF